MNAHETKKHSFSCDLCDKVFITRSHLNEHKQKDHLIPIIHPCPICKLEFNDKNELILHQKIHVQQKESDEKKNINNGKEKMEIKDDEEAIKVKNEPMDSDNSGMFIFYLISKFFTYFFLQTNFGFS